MATTAVKRALLVGCNYPGTADQLEGCVNDVKTVYDLLVHRFGFQEADVVLMIDTETTKIAPVPTGANIKAQLKKLVSQSKSGDMLFFHFSGHGTQIPSKDDDETDRLDEALCPNDMNFISDDDLKVILSDLDPGCKFTMVADSCHSGTLLDQGTAVISGKKGLEAKHTNPPPGVKNRFIPLSRLLAILSEKAGAPVTEENILTAAADIFKEEASVTCHKAAPSMGLLGAKPSAKPTSADKPLADKTIVLITGCQDNETSADAFSASKNMPMGALTDALVTVIEGHLEKERSLALTNRGLVDEVRKVLKKLRFEQNPCLECISATADTPFLLFNWTGAVDKLPRLSRDEIATLIAFFKHFDKDGNGYITLDEIICGSAVDINNDGVVTGEEAMLAAAPWLAMVPKQDRNLDKKIALEEMLRWNNDIRKSLHVVVATLGSNTTVDVEVMQSGTVADLKVRIEEVTGVPRYCINLMIAGTLMEASREVAKYKIKDGSVLFMWRSS